MGFGLVGALLAASLVASVSWAQAPAAKINPDLQDALDNANTAGRILLVDFYGGWCPWCVKMDETFANPEIKAIVDKQFFYYKLDVGRFDQHKDCLKQYNVEGIPTIVAFNPDGSVRLSKDSYMDVAAFKDFLAKAAAAGPEPSSPAAGSADNNPWSDNDKAMAVLKDYLGRMKMEFTTGMSGDDPLIKISIKMTNATHHMRIVVDGKKDLVYIFLNRYLSSKPGSDKLPAVLQRLMEENWNLNVGKFEWDKTDGEIRYSYCFSTENGIGYEAFNAVVSTLEQTADKLWPELKALTGE
jgi:thiol-disulfide isomerase/thioredoxin